MLGKFFLIFWLFWLFWNKICGIGSGEAIWAWTAYSANSFREKPQKPKKPKKVAQNIDFYSYLVNFEWFMLECLLQKTRKTPKNCPKHLFLQLFSDFAKMWIAKSGGRSRLPKSLNSCKNRCFDYFLLAFVAFWGEKF